MLKPPLPTPPLLPAADGVACWTALPKAKFDAGAEAALKPGAERALPPKLKAEVPDEAAPLKPPKVAGATAGSKGGSDAELPASCCLFAPKPAAPKAEGALAPKLKAGVPDEAAPPKPAKAAMGGTAGGTLEPDSRGIGLLEPESMPSEGEFIVMGDSRRAGAAPNINVEASAVLGDAPNANVAAGNLGPKAAGGAVA
jgi:hypothetical protein